MKKALIGSLLVGVVLAYACGADPLYQDETDTIITLQREGSDFSKYTTYYLPNSLVELCLQPDSGTPTSSALGGAAGGSSIDPVSCRGVDHSTDEAILDALADRMDDLGYTRTSDRDDADLALLVGIVARSSWSLDRPYCYPNGYFGGCVQQSGNPDIVVPYHSLILQLVDVEASSETNLHEVWTAAIHQNEAIGQELATSPGGGPSATKEKIWLSALEQAFVQSEYLAEGGAK